jgi:hypothetical protein
VHRVQREELARPARDRGLLPVRELGEERHLAHHRLRQVRELVAVVVEERERAARAHPEAVQVRELLLRLLEPAVDEQHDGDRLVAEAGAPLLLRVVLPDGLLDRRAPVLAVEERDRHRARDVERAHARLLRGRLEAGRPSTAPTREENV